MATYPNSYRRGAGNRGFQPSSPSGPARADPFRGPPTPANDNPKPPGGGKGGGKGGPPWRPNYGRWLGRAFKIYAAYRLLDRLLRPGYWALSSYNFQLWNVSCHNASAKGGAYWRNSTAGPTVCGVSQHVDKDFVQRGMELWQIAMSGGGGASGGWVADIHVNGQSGIYANRYDLDVRTRWVWTTGKPQPGWARTITPLRPDLHRQPNPLVRPAEIYPSLDPFSAPVYQPEPEPNPVPAWPSHMPGLRPYPNRPRTIPDLQPHPDSSPTENSSSGEPSSKPKPDGQPSPAFDLATGGALPPQKPRGRTAPNAREKEKKMRLTSAGRAALTGINAFTEGLDFLNALFSALDPKILAQYKGRKLTPAQKMEILWQNFDHIRVDNALQNLITNEIEDRIIGSIGQKVGQASRASGRPIGYQAGPAF